jgi:hypothetical protein
MNLNAESFTPNPVSSDSYFSDSDQKPLEPSYKCKIKTELCKFWQRGEPCHFGDSCAFAHGHDQLKKKVHVTSQYRLTPCHQFHSTSHYCFYGNRCQFAHIHTDFSDWGTKTRYTMLLSENQRVMQQRIEQSAEPDITLFNVALPSKKRLPAFEAIYMPEKKKRGTKKTLKKAEKSTSSPIDHCSNLVC